MRTQTSVQDEGKIGFITPLEQTDDEGDPAKMNVFISNMMHRHHE